MSSRQAQWAKAKRAERGLKKRGRKPAACPAHPGVRFEMRAGNDYVCPVCHPKKRVGRPKKAEQDKKLNK